MPNMNTAQGRVQVFTGSGVNDNDLALTTPNVQQHSVFQLMTTAGAADVEVTLDGTNWMIVPLALEDQNSTTPATRVVVTTAGRMFQFRGKYTQVRVRQAGITAADAILLCGTD